ncbi:MAG: protein kinase, partial [Acidobacteria bacterium]|nr:protein kinase [Acidobacteriota bacterium]
MALKPGQCVRLCAPGSAARREARIGWRGDDAQTRHTTWPLRGPLADWRRRHGRSLQGPRHAPEPRRGHQSPPGASGAQRRAARAPRPAGAETIANLHHAHICVLYDIGEQGGVQYLVMEYLEGETLATRLLKGALPLEQTLRYAIEISDALDKAHRKGATHRDIKPGNIMLTKEGSKILDFGLAKLKQA